MRSRRQDENPGKAGVSYGVYMDSSRDNQSVSLCVPARLRYLGLICAFVESFCKSLDRETPAEIVEMLKLAIDEACSNVVRHGYGGDCDSPLIVDALHAGDELIFTIIDRARKFDLAKAPVKIDPTPSDSGYGISIIHQAVDRLEHEWDGSRNITRLTKRLPQEEQKPG